MLPEVQIVEVADVPDEAENGIASWGFTRRTFF